MAQYWTPSGLAAIAQTESSGNPTAVNPSSSASGLYGFLDSTWQSIAPTVGVDINQYPTAASAPSSVQTAVAANTPISNWTCPGCNSAAAGIAAGLGNVTNTPFLTGVDANSLSLGPTASFSLNSPIENTGASFTPPAGTPDFFTTSVTPGSQASTPIADSGGQTLAGTVPDSGGGASFTFNPPVETAPSVDPIGNPVSASLPSWLGSLGGIGANLVTGGLAAPGQSSTADTAGSTGGDFFSNATATAWNFAQRFGLIFLAIVLIGVGAFWLAHHPDTVRAIRRVRG